jgi:molybdopterin/thiamine biosynthesis adenylyltransferase/molybdopterin converting factor small subunit
MQVTVHYLAQLRRAAGCASEQLEVETGGTLGTLFHRLADRHGEPFRRLLLDAHGGPQQSLLLFVAENPADASTVLRDGDEVTVLTPMAGGALPLSDDERALYDWQLGVEGFAEAGQERLKAATVLVTRCGGVGGSVAYQLAAAGVGRLILAHAGALRLDDLNRQLLMSHAEIGRPRAEQAARRLRGLNPFIEVVAIAENVNEQNVDELVGRADVVAGCAPLFRERLLLNRAAVGQGKPLVDCAMYELQLQLTTVLPGRSPCLACLYSEEPPAWQRRFPVFGAVAGVVGAMGAMEVIKVIAGLGTPLVGKLLLGDLGTMTFRTAALRRRPDCQVCRAP